MYSATWGCPFRAKSSVSAGEVLISGWDPLTTWHTTWKFLIQNYKSFLCCFHTDSGCLIRRFREDVASWKAPFQIFACGLLKRFFVFHAKMEWSHKNVYLTHLESEHYIFATCQEAPMRSCTSSSGCFSTCSHIISLLGWHTLVGVKKPILWMWVDTSLGRENLHSRTCFSIGWWLCVFGRVSKAGHWEWFGIVFL